MTFILIGTGQHASPGFLQRKQDDSIANANIISRSEGTLVSDIM